MSVPAIGLCGDVHYLDGSLVRLEQELAACRAAGRRRDNRGGRVRRWRRCAS